MKEKLNPHFDEFGLALDIFSFHNINVPDEDLAAINEMKIPGLNWAMILTQPIIRCMIGLPMNGLN